MTRVYEFVLPLAGNDGRDYRHAIANWQDAALRIAGGYTSRGAGYSSAWVDDKTGKTYRDTVAIIQVACTEVIRDKLLRKAAELFPDQVSFYYVDIGEAHFYTPTHDVPGDVPVTAGGRGADWQGDLIIREREVRGGDIV